MWPIGIAAAGIYSTFVMVPLMALAVQAVRSGKLAESLSNHMVLQAVQLTAFTTTVSLVTIVLLGTPLAYLLARKSNTVLRTVDLLVQLPIVLPPVVVGVALLMAFGRRGLLGPALETAGITLPFTTMAVVFAQVFVSAPFYVRSARLGFQGVNRRYEDLSQTLGLSPWRTFWSLSVPLAWPSIAAGMGLAWARALSEVGATIMFAGNLTGRTQTLPLAILSSMESDLPAAMAMSVISLAAAAVVLIALGLAGDQRSRGPT